MATHKRASATFEVGLIGIMEGIESRISFGEFTRTFEGYFLEAELKVPDTQLLPMLYKRTDRFLRFKAALIIMRRVVKDPQWRKDSKKVRRARKLFPRLLRELSAYRDIPPIAPLVRSAAEQIEQAKGECLQFERSRIAEEIRLSEFSRLEPESEFALQLNDMLKRKFPAGRTRTRLDIIAACFVGADLLGGRVDPFNLPDVIASRIVRAKQAWTRERLRYPFLED